MSLESDYKYRKVNHLDIISNNIENILRDILKEEPRIDRITARAKSVSSFMRKSENIDSITGRLKYDDPINEIQDQIGARVICFFQQDVAALSLILKREFREVESKNVVPEDISSFGYFGLHFINFLPGDAYDSEPDFDEVPQFFELQIKTLFQHAWAEANHDVGYKPGQQITADQERKIAFASAQAWGADMIFSELFDAKSKL